MDFDDFFKVLLSVIGFLLVYVLSDIKVFLKETRKKLDDHCEDFELHHYMRRESDSQSSD